MPINPPQRDLSAELAAAKADLAAGAQAGPVLEFLSRHRGVILSTAALAGGFVVARNPGPVVNVGKSLAFAAGKKLVGYFLNRAGQS